MGDDRDDLESLNSQYSINSPARLNLKRADSIKSKKTMSNHPERKMLTVKDCGDPNNDSNNTVNQKVEK